MSSFFKAVLVTGARQVGKTTMLRHLAEGQNRTYVTLDNVMARNLAKTDPVLFFQTYKPPIMILDSVCGSCLRAVELQKACRRC